MANEIKVQSKKKTKLIIIIVAILIALATIAAVIFVPKNAKARKVEEQLSLGTKYLTELDYEQAIVAYEAAIKIDPKCTDAYLGLADVYEEMGEFDKAAEVLAEAKQVIEDKDEVARIEKKQETIEEKKQEATKPTATPVPAPTATPEPTVAPAATPLPTPTLVPAPTEAPVATATPKPTEAPKPTATPKPTTVPKPTATPVPTTAPVAEQKTVALKLAADCFTYEQVGEDYLCTGLSEKGNAEFSRYGVNSTVSINLPAVSDSGKNVAGFVSDSADGYDLRELLTENSASVELVCPKTYTVYYGVGQEQPNGKYVDKLKNVVLNDGLEKIGWNAFIECTGLTEIVIPDSVKEIETQAFMRCSNLKIESLDLSGKTLGFQIFYDVTINKVIVNDMDKADGSGSFKGAIVNEVEIKEGLKEIPDYLFANCDSIKTVKLPNSLEKIGTQAFSNCTGLTEIEMPDNLTEIGGQAFFHCDNLRIERFDASGKTLSLELFTGVTIDKVIVNDMVKASGYGSFKGAIINEVGIKEGLKEIPNYLFANCDSIKTIKLPNGLEKIGTQAFSRCTGLTEIEMPESLKEIGGQAFFHCDNLKIDSFDVSGKKLSFEVFTGVTIHKVTVNDTVEANSGGCLKGAIVNEVEIKEGLKEIPNYLFADCESIKRVELPKSVEKIGRQAFLGCAGLTEIEIPANIKEIGTQAFFRCSNLTIVTSKGSAADAYAKEENIPVRYQ